MRTVRKRLAYCKGWERFAEGGSDKQIARRATFAGFHQKESRNGFRSRGKVSEETRTDSDSGVEGITIVVWTDVER